MEIWFIVNFLERFANFTQKTIGITCFGLARLCMIFSVSSSIIAIIFAVIRPVIKYPNLAVYSIIPFLILVIMILSGYSFLTEITLISLKTRITFGYKAMQCGMKNPFMIIPRFSLCGALPAFVLKCYFVSTGDWRIILLNIHQMEVYWLAVAFSSCTPSDCGKSLLGKGFDRAKKTLSSLAPGKHADPIAEPSPA